MTPRRLYDEYELARTTISHVFGGFLRGQLVIAILSGVVTATAAIVTGLRFGVIIGLIARLLPSMLTSIKETAT